ncbi:MAG: hypothetical protein JW915_07485 [Chitinispirillaceae bacterium]|nr:hypothetical protein [Chitinispirillaceae bacterium]
MAHGIYGGALYNSEAGTYKNFNIAIPNPKPAGKHLKIVLTWDSSPYESSDINELSDLDLSFQSNSQYYSSVSYESNVEIIDINASHLTAGSTYTAIVSPYTLRIPAGSYNGDHIYYSIAWTWVKDHAD